MEMPLPSYSFIYTSFKQMYFFNIIFVLFQKNVFTIYLFFFLRGRSTKQLHGYRCRAPRLRRWNHRERTELERVVVNLSESKKKKNQLWPICFNKCNIRWSLRLTAQFLWQEITTARPDWTTPDPIRRLQSLPTWKESPRPSCPSSPCTTAGYFSILFFFFVIISFESSRFILQSRL